MTASRAALPEVDLVARAEVVLLDWDGCLAYGDRMTPDAVRLIGRLAGKVAILSNNSTFLPEDLSRRIAAHGVTLPPDRIFLAGHQTMRLAAERFGPGPAFLMANDRLVAHAATLGLVHDEDRAVAAVLTRDPGFGYRTLAVAANLLRCGLPLLVSNPDTTHPDGAGGVVPETGALFRALQACVPLGPGQVTVVGKPSPQLFRAAMARMGAAPDRTVMIGDNPHTDIAGADALGIASILVNRPPGLPLASLA